MKATIPLNACIKGGLYQIDSRNMSLGVYDGADGFIGIRYKFGDRYLFTEYHCESITFQAYGTVNPLKLIRLLPSDIQPTERLVHSFGDSWAVNPETNVEEPVNRRDLLAGEKPHGGRKGFVDEWVSSGQRLPERLYPYLKGNQVLFKFIDTVKEGT